MKVNLKLLHTFLLVAEHGSFRRAAEEANRSQSAVSMQIRQLELQLGVALFIARRGASSSRARASRLAR